ncbi:hypothetical protein [Caldilinea sp.]|uniref:TolB family protein n=1 Tax=Caldilinea sp. TaxID=2293560 RepID=UPI002CD9717A|nr:hypothetical protein [Caldilinea sp.]
MCACPYLGLYDDATIMLSEATPAHRCYGTKPPTSPSTTHQDGYCLVAAHTNCPFYLAAIEQGGEGRVMTSATQRRRRGGSLVFASLLMLAVLVASAVFAANGSFGILPRPTPTLAEIVMAATNSPTAVATATLLPSPTSSQAATNTPTIALTELILPTNTPAPGGAGLVAEAQIVVLTPASGGAGWWSSADDPSIGLNDSFLYAGVYENDAMISAARFDLSRIPRGAPILSGELQLSGLTDERLNADADGLWRVQLIPENELANLIGADFMMVYSAAAPVTLRELRTQDLARDKVNTWQLGPETLRWLEELRVNGADSVIARMTASTNGDGDTLFAWDSGLGLKTAGVPPTLLLNVGPPPATPPPLPTYAYLVATFTPVPENVLTVVALQSTATAVAETIGTYTPVPPFITPTPFPQNLATVQIAALLAGLPAVVEETPAPANEATETALAEYATAVALTTGTFTPVPTQYVTPIVILPSPLPLNAATAVARIAEATTVASAGGPTFTPLPYNAVIGEFVIATPTPQNIATAAAIALAATSNAQVYGPATPTPFHWLVITPTPEPRPTSTPTTPPLIMATDFTPTPIPTATEFIPAALPDEYKNLIFFQRGTGPGAQTYIFDPTTEQIGLITRQWIYPLARESLTRSPDGPQEVFVTRDANGVAQVHIRSVGSDRSRQLTAFGRDSYDPAWSPTGEWIAFVSSNPGNDEIYRITPDGSVVERLTNNNWEWDKHPTWSPDGSQIVFFSNRDVGRPQLWIMNANGSGQRSLLSSEYEDLYPVWTR